MSLNTASKFIVSAALVAALAVPAFGATTSTTTHSKRRKAAHYATSETSSTLTGEQTAPSDFAIGFHMGPNISISSADAPAGNPGQTSDTGGNTRLMMGASLEVKLAHYVYVQPEFDFIQRGATTTIKNPANAAVNPGGTGQLTTSLDYLEIPLFFKAKYTDHLVHPYGLFGPGIGFLVGKGVSSTANNNVTVNTDQNDLAGNFKSVMFDLNFGAGADVAITSRLSAMMDLRYSLALASALSNTPQNQDVSLKNSGLQLLTGLQYAL